MRRNPVLILIAAVLIGTVLLGFQVSWFGSSKGNRMNVLLISIDSLRQDRVGIYGHRPEFAPSVAVSPNLDALGNDGVVFDNAWSTTSWTLPSHTALMTGLTDQSHGVVMDDFRRDPAHRTLAMEFRDAGYATAGYFSGPYLDAKYGFEGGFDDYRSGMLGQQQLNQTIQQQVQRMTAQGNPPQNLPAFVSAMRDRASHWDITSPQINRLAEQFLETHSSDEPFFLFLHYFDVHYDHIPEQRDPELAKRFDPEYRGSMNGVNWFFNDQVRDRRTMERKISERDLAHVKALYDAELHWVDRHIGQIFRKLRSKGLWENTIVMIVSDHGDEFFEHGSIGHRSTLYTELTKIPMILRVPGTTPPGKRVAQTARLYDVADTLLDYAGLDPLEQSEGRSLRAAIEDRESESPGVLQLMSFYRGNPGDNLRDGWRNDRYSVLRRFVSDPAATGEEDCHRIQHPLHPDTKRPWVFVFDRRDDPGEHRALSPDDPRYQEAIEAFCKDMKLSRAHAESLLRSPLDERYGPSKSAEERAALTALGYVDDSGELGPKLKPLCDFPLPCAD